MNDYGDTDPTGETTPIEVSSTEQPTSPGARAQLPAPTWEWSGTRPGVTGPSPYAAPFAGLPPYGGYPPYIPATPPAEARVGISRRTRGLGVAAAVLLVVGAAAGGAAFGYAHGGSGASASSIASGDSGVTAPQSPGQSQAPSQGPLGSKGDGQGGHHHRGGRPSSYVPPGHATADQQAGVVDINTRLKYQVAKAAGTGMILTSNGEILTNNHVVEGATKIKVTVVSTGKSYAATVVGTDKVDDIAVLQLSGASGLSTITADTDGVQVGDAVTAVGNAMGAGGIPSAAKGHVVGLNRSITTQSEGGVDGERLTGLIQVDAQVISGDSGGPLYDSQNEVIGIDTAASSSPMQSVGFAIPIAKAVSIADQIESGQAGGNIVLGVPGFLGIQFQPGVSGHGAVVAGVVPKTPAAQIGLVPGDTITRLSGAPVTSGEQLKALLLRHRGGDSVSLTWTDSHGVSHTGSVTLIDGPAD